MSCYDTNIYKVARLKAGKTQEGGRGPGDLGGEPQGL